MEKAAVEKRDSTSDQSPSDKEGRPDPSAIDAFNRAIPDPDEGLSEEERKKIVCSC